nr:MAG TPA: hypothetical protein [Caudoviricetes sp.]
MSDLLNKLNITDPELIAQYHKRKDILVYDDISDIIRPYKYRPALLHTTRHVPILRVNTWMDQEDYFVIHLSIRRVSSIRFQLNQKWFLETVNEIDDIKALIEEEKQLQTAFDGFEL